MSKTLNKTIRKVKARWWLVLAVLFTALEIGLPFFTNFIPPYLFGALSAMSGAGAFAARLMAQEQSHGD